MIIDGTPEPSSSCPTSTSPATINIVIDGTYVSTAFNKGLNLWRNVFAPSGNTITHPGSTGFREVTCRGLTITSSLAHFPRSVPGTCQSNGGLPQSRRDGDSDVDVADIIAVASQWNAQNYDPAYDLNCDGVIDIADVILVTANFGS